MPISDVADASTPAGPGAVCRFGLGCCGGRKQGPFQQNHRNSFPLGSVAGDGGRVNHAFPKGSRTPWDRASPPPGGCVLSQEEQRGLVREVRARVSLVLHSFTCAMSLH